MLFVASVLRAGASPPYQVRVFDAHSRPRLLDRSGEETLDEVTLEREEDCERNHERHEGGGRDDVDVRAESAQLREDRDGDRLGRAGEGQRDEQIVPRPE